MVVMAFDDLGLPDVMPFPSIKTRRRWTCQRCGNREVSVMPNWRDPREVQTERIGQAEAPEVVGAFSKQLYDAARRP